MEIGTQAQKLVWEGAIPLQIHLHQSEVTTLPPPPPALVLGPRIGYLPLLVPLIKPHFNNTLPPGTDTIWFEFNGLPLKWNTPTGVLFDLLCAEPERPWNLTVHFRGYPGDILCPCDGEDSVKWNFINSLKEAAYIINGNCKNIMNMSQSDQLELWHCVVKGNMEGYLRISSKCKLGTVGEERTAKSGSGEADISGSSRTGRIPVRLYVRNIGEDIDDLEDVTTIDSWDKVSYINHPVEIHREEGKYFTLRDAVKSLLPDFFMDDEPSIDEQISSVELEAVCRGDEVDSGCAGVENVSSRMTEGIGSSEKQKLDSNSRKAKIRLIRIQGIEPRWDVPFSWIVNNLMNPEHYLHICIFVEVSTTNQQAEAR
ncbi:hypothetical protein AAC387_Pa04g2124 [Persea americana]